MSKCYICEENAVGACSDCHKPVCAGHFIDSHGFGNIPKRKCPDCASKTKTYSFIFCTVIIVLWLVFMFSFVFPHF